MDPNVLNLDNTVKEPNENMKKGLIIQDYV